MDKLDHLYPTYTAYVSLSISEFWDSGI